MKTRTVVRSALLAVAFLLVGACGSDDGVPWGDYAPQVHERIDAMAESKDCSGLQAEIDTADVNNEATMARTGHNNAKLMGYIDDLMRKIGCYG